MNRHLRRKLLAALGLAAIGIPVTAQISLQQDFVNKSSAPIGTYQGINFREGGFSGLYPIQGTNGKEFWVISDRGVNIDAANANPASCRPSYDKIFVFPNYTPKIHRIRLNGDSVQILRTITMKRPDKSATVGVLNPTGFGSTAAEMASTDTVLDCANFSARIANKDTWAIDAEAIVVDKDGYFWISEENGPTIWKLNPNGVVMNRYTPYGNLAGAQPQDIAIDSVFRYRKNNRGFENLTITPSGKLYAVIQSPIQFPNATVGDASRIHRILELNPATGAMRMLAYVNDGPIASGSNGIRNRDWKLGDIAAINDTTFLVLEAAARGTSDYKRMYQININGASAVTSGLYGTNTLEGLVDSAGMAAQGLAPVKKTLVMDLLANGWPKALDKAEGLAILNDSTIFIANDNDFGQYSPGENGIATATGTLSHVIRYGLAGFSKLRNFSQLSQTLSGGITGPSTATGPYLVPSQPGVKITSILTAGEVVNGYKFVGTPDGTGAYDNNDGTFTLLVNHEFGNNVGAVHAYGANGAFVSKWIINKSDLSVVGGSDLISQVKLWNPATSSYVAYNKNFLAPNNGLNFGRHCSADLPAATAFYNPKTGKGTQSRIFMNGEETGSEGRGLAHIATGPEAGTMYEIPRLGKYSYENAVASPRISDTTVVVGLDDAGGGQVYFYMGTKQSTGTEVEKAGLTNGNLWGFVVGGTLYTEGNANMPAPNTAFTMVNLGNVENMTGSALGTASDIAGVAKFLRPEDGAWDPQNPGDFYFNTTNSVGSPSRCWRMRFTDPGNITKGGTITAVLSGTEGQEMLDNLTIDNGGHILHVEDVGGNARLGRLWQYDIATDTLIQLAVHDSTRFLNGSANFLTQDEEASGQIDAQAILGPGMFLLVDQAHYGISGDVVEGGQLMALYNPATAAGNPEVALKGNNVLIQNNDMTPALTDSTDFGIVNRGTSAVRNYVIENAGPGALNVRELLIEGANAGSFSIVGAPALPFTIAAGGTRTVQVRFAPAVDSVRNATLYFVSNDFDEEYFSVALRGQGASPEINVSGNGQSIINGDPTPGTANNTDFGTTNIGTTVTKSFTIQNTGLGSLTLDSISFSGVNATEFIVSGTTFPLTIAAGSTQSITVQFAPAAGGIRTATLAAFSNDTDEATYSFALQGRGIERVGVNPVNTSSVVKLFPNPTGGNATIAMSLKKDDRIIVNILNLEGKQAVRAIDQRYSAGEQSISLPTAGLPNGTYFVEVATGTQTLRMQLVVLH